MSTLAITTTIEDNMWMLSFSLNEPSDIPRDIFIFENTGTGIGEYQGVCSLTDYGRFQTYVSGVDIPVFGTKFVKYDQGILIFPIERDPAPIRAKILSDVRAFKAAYISGSSSTDTYSV